MLERWYNAPVDESMKLRYSNDILFDIISRGDGVQRRVLFVVGLRAVLERLGLETQQFMNDMEV